MDANAAGRTCAVAGQSQRQMQQWAEKYAGIFGARPFDATLFSSLSLASAFSGPALTAEQLRMANGFAFWCFGLDWLVDYRATTEAEVHGTARRCRSVVDGAPPGDDLTRFLAELHAELTAAPAYPVLGPVWRDDLDRMLDGMAREWVWKTAGRPPTLDEYLANADNLGLTVVYTAHWIHAGPAPDPAGVPAVRSACDLVQRAVRLLNDLATYGRDVRWGDLNALLLGVPREEVVARTGATVEQARAALDTLRATQPEHADYLRRQLDFCVGFYARGDYWGVL